MKDQYRKELKKQPELKSGSGASEFVSTWQYFEAMSFIRDEIIPSKTSGNLIDSDRYMDTEETESSSSNSRQGSIVENVQSPPFVDDSLPCESSSTSSSSTRKRSANSLREDMILLEKRKLDLMEQRLNASQANQDLNRDEDYLYLMSILPTMQKLNSIQKLRLRGKINEWLLLEMTGNNYSDLSTSHHSIDNRCSSVPQEFPSNDDQSINPAVYFTNM